MKRMMIVMVALVCMVIPQVQARTACAPTGFGVMTAALVNPGDVIGGAVNASGCDIGIYYSGQDAKVQYTSVTGALWYGVMVHGDTTTTNVDVLNSQIYQIGDFPLNGNQRGIGIYYRAFLSTGSATGRVSGNRLWNYQKGGVVVNGPGSNVQVQGNEIIGQGPVGFIAQNGIQFGYGSSGSAMKNTVTGHAYTGSSTVSGGIIVVGGPGYGTCPDGNPCSYTTGIQIVQNVLDGNDVGAFLTNLRADFNAPDDATNIKAVNNKITKSAVTNSYCYQAGVSDVGNNDKIINNTISGAGYNDTNNCYAVEVDADTSFTNRPKVHANK